MARRVRWFSRKPWLEKQRQLKAIKQNKLQHEKEMRERRKWAITKSFNESKYKNEWAKYKKVHEKWFIDLALNSISVCDGAESANEILLRGLGLRDTAIEMDSVEDLAFNIYLLSMAEHMCSAKGANLSKETTDRVISALIGQIMPPTVPQKQLDPDKGQKVLEQMRSLVESGQK